MTHLSLIALIVPDYDIGIAFFVRVLEFEPAEDVPSSRRPQDAGATFNNAPRTEAYGRVVVFQDIFGNKWDLLGPVA
jgi:catechol 2,3-dioxygenase-like lactoylglutathione lyase family enzyme